MAARGGQNGLAHTLDLRSSMLAYGTRRVTNLHPCLPWLPLASMSENSYGDVGFELLARFIDIHIM